MLFIPRKNYLVGKKGREKEASDELANYLSIEHAFNSLSTLTTGAARIRQAAHQIVATSVPGSWPTGFTRVTFDTVDFDTGHLTNAGTPNRLTFPVAGEVVISLVIPCVDNGNAGIRYGILALNNASVFAPQTFGANIGFDTIIIITTITNVKANDFYEGWIAQNSGANVQLGGAVIQPSLSAGYI